MKLQPALLAALASLVLLFGTAKADVAFFPFPTDIYTLAAGAAVLAIIATAIIVFIIRDTKKRRVGNASK
jgi:hypothetical protein